MGSTKQYYKLQIRKKQNRNKVTNYSDDKNLKFSKSFALKLTISAYNHPKRSSIRPSHFT